jgi:hypothetical protein
MRDSSRQLWAAADQMLRGELTPEQRAAVTIAAAGINGSVSPSGEPIGS